jgi:polygalacturonase
MQTIPRGGAGIITLVGEDDTDKVKDVLTGAANVSAVGVDGDGVRELREALESAVADAAASGEQTDR